MTETRLWTFSVHAQSRGASRFNLLIDEKAKIEISKQLDGSPMLVTDKNTRNGCRVFEITVFGVRAIAVCDPARRTVVTLMEAKRYYRRIKNGRGRDMRRRSKYRKGPVDMELDYGDHSDREPR